MRTFNINNTRNISHHLPVDTTIVIIFDIILIVINYVQFQDIEPGPLCPCSSWARIFASRFLGVYH